MHMIKTLRRFSIARMIFVHLQRESLNLILAQRSEVSNVNSSSLLYPQSKGDPTILKELYPTYLRQTSQVWRALGNFLTLSIPLEKIWMCASGPGTAMRQQLTFHCLELSSMTVVSIIRDAPQLFQRTNPLFSQIVMNIFTSFLPMITLIVPLFLLPLPAKSSAMIRLAKIERSGLQIIFFQCHCLTPVTSRLYMGKKHTNQFMFWQFWCLSHISKISPKWKSNRNNNHSPVNTILILVYRKIGSRQDFTTKMGTSQ